MASPVPISADEQQVRLEAHDDRDLGNVLTVLDLAVTGLDGAGVDYLLMGGIASSCFGRQRWTHDVDLFVRPADARRALLALAGAGFETEETFPDWLYKAWKDGELVDLIFRSGGDIVLDAEMLERAPTVEFMGRALRAVPPEDLVVTKAIVAAEHAPRHWHDALAIIATTELDWEYLARRARHGIRRTLALLLYAQSNDLPVPWAVTRQLFERLEVP